MISSRGLVESERICGQSSLFAALVIITFVARTHFGRSFVGFLFLRNSDGIRYSPAQKPDMGALCWLITSLEYREAALNW